MPMGDGDSQRLSSIGNHTQSPTLHDITSQKTIITTYALLSLLLTVIKESLTYLEELQRAALLWCDQLFPHYHLFRFSGFT